MLNDKAKKSKKVGGFVYPKYDGFSLPNIPNTISYLLGAAAESRLSPTLYENIVGKKRPKKIVFFVLDGFGYKEWLRYHKHFKFFRTLSEKGQVSEITSTFPSTTACAITSLNTGLLPVQHELPEWQIYSEKLDAQIYPLPFIKLAGKKIVPIRDEEWISEHFFRGKTISQKLAAKHIKTYFFQPKSIISSPYNNKLSKDGIKVPYYTLADLFVNLRQHIEKEKGRAYFYVYLPEIDTIEHHYGPRSEHNYAMVSIINHLMQTEFLDKLDKKQVHDTLLLLSADHGQIGTQQHKRIILNKYKWLAGMFEIGKNGNRIEPTGSPKDLFLHIKPEKLDKAKELLGRTLGSKAVVCTMDELAKKGVFGNAKPRRAFINKLGNLAILPLGDNTVEWDYGHHHSSVFVGRHGGLSEEEMLVPFAVAWLDKLVR